MNEESLDDFAEFMHESIKKYLPEHMREDDGHEVRRINDIRNVIYNLFDKLRENNFLAYTSDDGVLSTRAVSNNVDVDADRIGRIQDVIEENYHLLGFNRRCEEDFERERFNSEYKGILSKIIDGSIRTLEDPLILIVSRHKKGPYKIFYYFNSEG